MPLSAGGRGPCGWKTPWRGRSAARYKDRLWLACMGLWGGGFVESPLGICELEEFEGDGSVRD